MKEKLTLNEIKLLDEFTINQIAAGEVIESATSVIKELVENAIDAGASEIHVETVGAGRAWLQVSDNGCGMEKEQLLLAIQRHATSKLHSLKDLDQLKTLGFRGEALPSIASVSKMTLHSSVRSGQGEMLQLIGGRIESQHCLPRSQGTRIEVAHLFFNVPVRKKFQRSEAHERGEIHKLLMQFALCYPSLGFSWSSEGKKIWKFHPEEALELRLRYFFPDFMKEALPLEAKDTQSHLCGWIGLPHCHRPNKTGQYFFLNQRLISSAFAARALLEGYGRRLPPHRYPLFVLHLTLPSSWIDVNVHPQKKEVRLFNEAIIIAFLKNAVSQALAPPSQEAFSAALSFPPPLVKEDESHPSLPKQLPWGETYIETYSNTLLTAEAHSPYQARAAASFVGFSTDRLLALIGPYLIVESTQGIEIIDSHAARARIFFEKFHHRKQERGEERESQKLLIPISLTFTGKEKCLLLERLEELQARGIAIRHFGGESFVIEAVPSGVDEKDLNDFLHIYLEHPLHEPLERWLGRLKPILLTQERAEQLLNELESCQEKRFTPTGHPIRRLLEPSHFHKLFARECG